MSAAPVAVQGPAYDLVLWHLLICDAQAYWQDTGEWPESVWRAIHHRDYRAARLAMDQLTEEARAVPTRATPYCPQEEDQ